MVKAEGAGALTLLDLSALPLADAGPAGIGQHGAANLLENVQQAIALDSGTNLLATWRDGKGHLHTSAVTYSSRLSCSKNANVGCCLI